MYSIPDQRRAITIGEVIAWLSLLAGVTSAAMMEYHAMARPAGWILISISGVMFILLAVASSGIEERIRDERWREEDNRLKRRV